ncbi:MAG: hypothetical protein V4685_11925 [Bacteroidota bacterium]
MTQAFLKYYQDLPGTMEEAAVKNEFINLLEIAYKNSIPSGYVFDALYELADRQYHTYSYLDKSTKQKIVEWLFRNWVIDSKFIETIGMIVGSIGLSEVIPMLKKSIDTTLSKEIKSQLEKIIIEIEPHCENPYHDLK